MNEDDPPRKKPLEWLKKSRPEPAGDLAEERGRRAANDKSSLSPSSNASRGRFSRLVPKLLRRANNRSAQSARQSPNLDSTTATFNAQDLLRSQTSQDPSSPIASTSEPNFDQSSNADVAKAHHQVESPPDMKCVMEKLVHAQTGVTGISPIQEIVQNIASVSDNLQAVPDMINTFSKILGPLKTFNSVANGLADVCVSISFSYATRQCHGYPGYIVKIKLNHS
ncbi:hypothetical protein DEU56DRAFT_908408 [Suillus clintonianus]|uniref:uncharacterized protein n=1 Tax=Suillus clintonianus TaxID=1904413 RepID=UPI001B87545A|nr:uncharacterized protein DEU56DRAFT_908408 [Suillus clintonianus]KAG2150771.1 hypothetical protein DEU56DRAFT_908408 [Suillus clintonianus]